MNILSLGTVAAAATLTVGPNGDHATISGAVADAAPGDVIEIEAGTYDEDTVTLDLDLTIVGTAGSAATTWNGPNPFFGGSPALIVEAGADVSLQGITLSGLDGEPALVVTAAFVSGTDLVVADHVASFSLFASHGAIQLDQSELVLDGSVLRDNAADQGSHLWADGSTVTLVNTQLIGGSAETGGGLWARDSTLVVQSSTLEGNAASAAGGGMWLEDSRLDVEATLWIDNHATAGWGSQATGGGLYTTGATTATLVGATFDANTSDLGGGAAHLTGSTLATITDSQFVGNAGAWGGGLSLTASDGTTVTSTDLSGNQAQDGDGGAIHWTGSGLLHITDGRLDANSATGRGGGLFAAGGGALTVDAVDVIGNDANRGGGLATVGVADATGQRLRVCSNTATDGAGVWIDGGGGVGHRWTNVVFAENVATSLGGGMAVVGADPVEIHNDTFLGNSAGTGGALHLDGTVTVSNVIVAFTTGGDGLAGPGPGVTVDHSLFWDNLGIDLPDPLLTGATGLLFSDPLLAAVSADGDCTNDEAWPLPGSPVIDAGDPALLDPDGSRSDIGAFGGPEADWTDLVDEDGDGYTAGVDCDDGDPAVHPDAPEVCNGIDDDCDTEADTDAVDAPTWYEDEDGDGYGVEPVVACEAPPGHAPAAGDCDDQLASVFPGANEICNAIDDDCNDAVDDGISSSWWPDADGDGYGVGEIPVEDCQTIPGHAQANGDCDDADPAVNPGAPDPLGDGIDDNCDGRDGLVDDPTSDEDVTIGGGCTCSTSTGSTWGGLWWLAPLGLLLTRGRR